MIVIVSWHADGSGKPQITFRDVTLDGAELSKSSLGLLVEDVRATEHQECAVYSVWDRGFTLLYDSTE